MKKIIISSLLMLLSISITQAQSPQVKKSAQSTFKLTTFKADGTQIAESHGVFVDDGYGVSSWKPFEGAAKAIVEDVNGKRHDVECIVGANELYNVAKFRVTGSAPTTPVAKSGSQKDQQLWLSCYSTKGSRLMHAKINKVETFMETLSYYIMDITTPDDADFCPLFNANGEFTALLTPAKVKGIAYGVDAKLPSEFVSTPLSMTNSTLAKCLIPTELPKDVKSAQLALVLAREQKTTEGYASVVDAFIGKFPNDPDGYQSRAQIEMTREQFDAASKDMEKAISVATDKGDQYHAYSELILQKHLYMPTSVYEPWSLDRALELATKASSVNDLPVYINQQARILFAQQKYDEAYSKFMSLQETSMKGPETLTSALDCLVQKDAPFSDQIVLMDSIIASCPHPLTYQSGRYVLRRGMMYHQNGDYRRAMMEYADYEKLMVGNQLSPEFYYTRFTCERDGKMYQLAIDDISKAIDLQPRNPVFYCEKGSLLLRLGKSEDAMAIAQKCLLVAPRYADAFAILGTAQCILGKKYEGLLNLDEAKTLGYENADKLIQKYK